MNKTQFHVVSTGRQSITQLLNTIRAIHPYVDAIHIREKAKTAKEIYQLLSLLTAEQVSKIIINDRIDVAYIAKVSGVQLGYQSLPVSRVKSEFPSLKVGCSVHSLEEAKDAWRSGADYVIYGHIFSTDSKPGLTPRGIEQLQIITDELQIPVLAIGGVKPSNVSMVLAAGAAGIAVMSGVFEAKDPVQAVKEYRDSLFS